MIYNGLIEIKVQTSNFRQLLRQEVKVPLLRLMRSTLSQTLPQNWRVGVDNQANLFAAVHAKLGRNCLRPHHRTTSRPHRCEYFALVWGRLYALKICRLRLKCEGTCAETNFVFLRNGRVHLSRWGFQFSRLLAAEVCASAVAMVVMLDSLCSEVVWRAGVTDSIRQFPLHFPSDVTGHYSFAFTNIFCEDDAQYCQHRRTKSGYRKWVIRGNFSFHTYPSLALKLCEVTGFLPFKFAFMTLGFQHDVNKTCAL